MCPTLSDPWIVACQASLSMGFTSKNTGVGRHSLLQGIFLTQGSNPGLLHCRQILYHLYSGYGGSDLVAKLCLTLVTPWTVTCQTPLSLGFSRQEYWSGLSFPSPGDLPNIGIRSGFPALKAGFLPTELQGKLCSTGSYFTICALAILLCKNSLFHFILITNAISKLLYK